MVNAREEIGVIANRRRQMPRAIRGAVQQPGPKPAHRRRCVVRQQGKKLLAQRSSRPGAECHQAVETGSARGPRRLAGEQSGAVNGFEIKNFIPDRDAAARRVAVRAEHPEGKILQREIRMHVGGGDPAPSCPVVGVVDHAEKCFFMPSQHAS